MKTVERVIDGISPQLSVRLRLVKKRLRREVTLAIINRLVRPGDAVIDIGAHRGVYTFRLARQVGPNGQVWSIEPLPDNVAALRRIGARMPNVTVWPCAASDRVGQEDLSVPVYAGRRLGALATLGQVSAPSETVTIEVRTLDSLLSEGGSGRSLSFIRCDVVGHEAAVLEGAKQTILAVRPSLLVEIEQRHQASPIQTTLDQLSDLYTGYFIRNGSLVPVERFDLQRDQLSFLSDQFIPYDMPSGYVHYFLFVGTEADLDGLIEP